MLIAAVVILVIVVIWLAYEVRLATRDSKTRHQLELRQLETAAHQQLMATRRRMRALRPSPADTKPPETLAALGRRFGDPRWFNNRTLN